MGDLGGYGGQYAKLLGGGVKIVAFDRDADKLALAKGYGADFAVDLKDASQADVASAKVRSSVGLLSSSIGGCARAHVAQAVPATPCVERQRGLDVSYFRFGLLAFTEASMADRR
jgi:threonine dehydrogenase-like Zn-dependent dehydrogenase